MLIKKIKSDKGAFAGVLFLAFTMFILLVAILAVDVFKIIYIKSNLMRMAQTATQTAVKQQDRIGGLKPEAARAVVDEYLALRNGTNKQLHTSEILPFVGPCDPDKHYPKFKITFDNGRRVGSTSVSYESEGGNYPIIPNAESFYKNQYTTIQIKIEDIVYNDFGSIFGKQCSVVGMHSSAIATGHFDYEN